MYDYVFTHDKLITMDKKMTPNLHFLQFIIYNQISVVIFLYTKICWYTKKNN
jgi:hypothetical protein